MMYEKIRVISPVKVIKLGASQFGSQLLVISVQTSTKLAYVVMKRPMVPRTVPNRLMQIV